MWLCLKGDSSANDGILKRSGAGKVKHLSVRQLWLQEKVGEVVLWHEKIPRAINVADAMTHYFTKPEALTHFSGMSCHRSSLQQSVGNTMSALPKGGRQCSRCLGSFAASWQRLFLYCFPMKCERFAQSVFLLLIGSHFWFSVFVYANGVRQI